MQLVHRVDMPPIVDRLLSEYLSCINILDRQYVKWKRALEYCAAAARMLTSDALPVVRGVADFQCNRLRIEKT